LDNPACGVVKGKRVTADTFVASLFRRKEDRFINQPPKVDEKLVTAAGGRFARLWAKSSTMQRRSSRTSILQGLFRGLRSTALLLHKIRCDQRSVE